ncbi:MAG: hypothetical protein JO286_21705 [Solirubrobacterales bacterium]|nr:hypothetical protein [Solirubrobacterales bacterium]MBV9809815.1 hypothetical protein [Solirubrobacterales bacterium]
MGSERGARGGAWWGRVRGDLREGIAELERRERLAPGRVRRPGGRRKRLAEIDATLLEDLELLVEADSRSDPESLLRWTSKSVRHFAAGCAG